VPQTPFEWKAKLGSAFNTAYHAQLGNVTYYVTSRDYGHPAYLEVRDQRGGLKRLDLGNYHKIEQAKQACERHYAAGCDLGQTSDSDQPPRPIRGECRTPGRSFGKRKKQNQKT